MLGCVQGDERSEDEDTEDWKSKGKLEAARVEVEVEV